MQHDLVLEGPVVTLVPLAPAHAAALADLVDERLWAWMTSPVPAGEAAMAGYVASALDDPTREAFAVLDTASGDVLGSTSFYEWVPTQERLEIGHTFYGRSSWGTAVNPATKLLLLEHAFGERACHRVALRCDARNERSAAAIRALGATYEGTLRGHRVAADGSRGDTAYFSILRPEWPAARERLRARAGAPGG